jgi:pSer/pThr/pTyr-binding forkhead associated (FHA) protein
MASIIVASGQSEGDYYPLEGQTVVVGRDAKCPIQIVDEKISRVHLEITFRKDSETYHAKDLKSVNGVLVNGNLITEEVELRNGDLIELGDTSLMFFTRRFLDRKSAWDFYKMAGQRGKGTLIQDPGTSPKPGIFRKRS